MDIVSESRTGCGRAREIVAAGAKAGRKALPVFLALGLGACASTFSSMPTELGGMPAGTPQPQQQPAPAGYPAVHDMPPPRPDTVLTQEERKKAEAELMALRERQEKEAGTFPQAPPKPAQATSAPTKPRDADQIMDEKDQ